MTNIAYVLGYDGVVFNANTRTFVASGSARGLGGNRGSKLHINKILPTIQNRLARICKNPPKYDVRPESNLTEDKDAARLAIQVLGTMWEKLTIQEKRILLGMWVQECGHAYIQVGWDPMAGGLMTDPTTGETDFQGDVFTEVGPPFEYFPDPHAKSFDDVTRTWLIRARSRPLSYFAKMYGEKGKQVKEEGVWLLSAQYENRIQGMNNRGPGSGGQPESAKGCAIELIKWEAATREHPHGRVIVCAGDVLLKDEELPRQLSGMIPVAKFDDIQVAGKYYPEAVVTHLRPIQDQLNYTIRARANWTRKLVAGKYKAARGSNLGQEAVNDDVEVMYYDVVPNAPGGIEPVQVPTIPQFAYQEEDRLDEKFNEISGISEVSKGNIPSASIPAVGMQLLVEQDDSRIGIMTEQHEHSWARVGSLILKFIEFGYTMPRKLKMSNKGTQYTITELKGDMLKGNTDVYVIRGSTLPGSKTLKRQEIMNAYGQGLLGDPLDPRVKEKVLGMIEFGDVQDLWEDYALDQAQIKKGMDALCAGEEVIVSQFDNHAMWLAELNKFRKSGKFADAPLPIQDAIVTQMYERLDAMADLTAPPPPPPEATPSLNELNQMAQGGPEDATAAPAEG